MWLRILPAFATCLLALSIHAQSVTVDYTPHGKLAGTLYGSDLHFRALYPNDPKVVVRKHHGTLAEDYHYSPNGNTEAFTITAMAVSEDKVFVALSNFHGLNHNPSMLLCIDAWNMQLEWVREFTHTERRFDLDTLEATRDGVFMAGRADASASMTPAWFAGAVSDNGSVTFFESFRGTFRPTSMTSQKSNLGNITDPLMIAGNYGLSLGVPPAKLVSLIPSNPSNPNGWNEVIPSVVQTLDGPFLTLLPNKEMFMVSTVHHSSPNTDWRGSRQIVNPGQPGNATLFKIGPYHTFPSGVEINWEEDQVSIVGIAGNVPPAPNPAHGPFITLLDPNNLGGQPDVWAGSITSTGNAETSVSMFGQDGFVWARDWDTLTFTAPTGQPSCWTLHVENSSTVPFSYDPSNPISYNIREGIGYWQLMTRTGPFLVSDNQICP